jgi:hypothetical protein
MDHERIRRELDRSATSDLVGQLLTDDPDAAEREQIERTLIALDDVRAVVPLHAAGENSTTSPIVRLSALQVLTSMLGATVLPIREWWTGHDPVLRFAAASVLPHREFSDLVRPVLDQPGHPMLARVLASMDIGFEEGHWQEAKVRALTNASATVRAAAATSLLWDEPLCAHDALVVAANDLDVDVAVEAVSTLMYYPTTTVVATLSALSESPNEWLASSAETACARVLSDVADAVAVAPGSPVMRRWSTLLRQHDFAIDAAPEFGASSLVASSTPLVFSWTTEFERQLADPNGPWEDRFAALRNLDPNSVPSGDRGRVAEVLAHHPDPEVRSFAAKHLPVWSGGADALLRMLDDPMTTVAKSAMFALHDVETDSPLVSTIRERAWDAVADGTRVSTRASEALRTFVRHGDAHDPDDVTRRLVGLGDDPRESVRSAALEQLVVRNCESELRSSMTQLGEPPDITWAIHGTLLDAAYRFGIDVGRHTLLRLGREDHAWLCGAVARLLPNG